MGRIACSTALALVACGPAVSTEPSDATESNDDTTTGAAPEPSTATGGSTEAGPLGTSGSEPTSSTSGESSFGDTAGGTTETAERCETYLRPGCPGATPLRGVSIAVASNAFGGEDVPLEFDPSLGSVACWDVVHDGGLRIEVWLGPFDLCRPQTRLSLTVYDGARLYDLETDPGPPATLEPGLIRLGAAYRPSFALITSYDTINQAGVGSVDVRALPTFEDMRVEFAAAGTIATAEGWAFDLEFSATMD